MNKNQIAISSLAMDLKRIALGYYRGSYQMAKSFSKEALKRKEEIDTTEVKPYIRKIMKLIPEMLGEKDTEKLAEDALMYSTLLQNYVTKDSNLQLQEASR